MSRVSCKVKYSINISCATYNIFQMKIIPPSVAESESFVDVIRYL